MVLDVILVLILDTCKHIAHKRSMAHASAARHSATVTDAGTSSDPAEATPIMYIAEDDVKLSWVLLTGAHFEWTVGSGSKKYEPWANFNEHEGVRLSEGAIESMAGIVSFLLTELIRDSVTFVEHGRCKTVRETDIIEAVTCRHPRGCNPIPQLFRHGILHANALRGHANASILSVLAGVGALELYTGLLRNASVPIVEATKVVGACRDDRKLLLSAFSALSSGSVPIPLVASEAVAASAISAAPAMPSAIDPANSQELPIDPNGWLLHDQARRQAFTQPTDELSPELLNPFMELYDVFADRSVFQHRSDYMELEPHLLMGNNRHFGGIATESQFFSQWGRLTQGVFDGVDMSNCFIAGGSVLACLLPGQQTDCIDGEFGASDIDVFVYGVDKASARRRLMEVLFQVAKRRAAVSKSHHHHVLVHSKHAVTLVGYDRFRPVQFILRIYRSPSEVLLGFDVDACCVGLSLGPLSSEGTPSAGDPGKAQRLDHWRRARAEGHRRGRHC
jgi:hypothetical protein